MAVEVKVTTLPESVEEGTLMNWYKAEGDAVHRDDKIADIETDKVVLDVASPIDGVLSHINKKAGDPILRDDVIATIEAGDADAAPAPAVPEVSEPPPEKKPADEVRPPAAEPKQVEPARDEPSMDRISPAARKWIREHDLNPDDIAGSGKDGRVTKADVIRHMQGEEEPKVAEPALASSDRSAHHGVIEDELRVPVADSGRREERVPMTRLRARVAERLIQAQQTAAILTTFNEVDMLGIVNLRKQYKDQFEKEHGVKLGFMSFFIKAAVEALKRFPVVNASIDGQDIVYHGYFDIGVAVSTDRGLVVPILRNADQLGFAAIERAVVDFAQRAREGKLTLEELTGGTFTITNGGVFGSLLSTPILNPPQSAILGMHKMQDRPVVEDGQIVIRPMMYLALSYDHRLVDGRDAVTFLVTMKEFLEDPARLMLQA
ncbi:MAG: 2-oxoglutarate dehydrogenase complex dihydrolipoyllysine-residue succinyltransferase [Verrucomicrobia bacterium]|nr:2-oxoglutarate dehydrogenase complex dihydrolipoyllysine-residue succinyltransferase [Verrucomicrobiota bacterium]